MISVYAQKSMLQVCKKTDQVVQRETPQSLVYMLQHLMDTHNSNKLHIHNSKED